MTISIWMAVVIGIVSLMVGFWIGRSIKWMTEETEERVKAQEDEAQGPEVVKKGRKKIPLGWVISSPVSGQVRPFYEGNKCGALILPEEDKIYAPVTGRIVRLYPMGKAMVIATDFGCELLLKVGTGGDDLCSDYYRSRVVQNEIIGKGKILLEFDREGLESRGVDTAVIVSMETTMEDRNIVVNPKEYIKAGEELMWV